MPERAGTRDRSAPTYYRVTEPEQALTLAVCDDADEAFDFAQDEADARRTCVLVESGNTSVAIPYDER